MRFVRFSYYKTAKCTAPCSAMRCDALLLTVGLYHFVRGLVNTPTNNYVYELKSSILFTIL